MSMHRFYAAIKMTGTFPTWRLSLTSTTSRRGFFNDVKYAA